jgi:LacI family transcriptional regulator
VRSKDGRATLATVAASAGVSVATVSKVLNGHHDVAPATRALIKNLLRQHDYVARRAVPPRRPVPDNTRLNVRLAFHGPLTPYSMEILQGVLDTAAEVGVPVTVTSSPRPGVAAAEPRRTARPRAAGGRRAVIAVVNERAVDTAALTAAGVPFVVIDPLYVPPDSVTSVGSTNFAGGLAATQHLLSLGHRRIGYLGGPAEAPCSHARLHGYRAAMETAGERVPATYLRAGHFRYEDGIDQGAIMLALPRPPTAIFAGNDETAVGVIEAARARGLRVPEDLSIVGFDNTQVARLSSPPLTTVHQPLREMGGVALRTAIRLVAGERLDSHHVELATRLVVRRSTAAPPEG